MTTEQTDMAAQALAELPSCFDSAEKFQALVECLAGGWQDVEAVLWDLLEKRLLENAEGVNLDVIGRLVRQPRRDLDDSDYRKIISAAILTMNSETLEDNLTEIVDTVTGAATVEIYDTGPPGYLIQWELSGSSHLSDDLLDRLKSMLEEATGFGINFDAVEGVDGVFRLDDPDHGLDQGKLGSAL